MDNICRICRDSEVTLVGIFTERSVLDVDASLAEMISEFAACEVLRGDPLPQEMCISCVVNAQTAFRFKRKCEESHLYFWQLLKEQGQNVYVPEAPAAVKSQHQSSIKIKQEPCTEETHEEERAISEQSTKENMLPNIKQENTQDSFNDNQLSTDCYTEKQQQSIPANMYVRSKYYGIMPCRVLVARLKMKNLSNSNRHVYCCKSCDKIYYSRRDLYNHERFHVRRQAYADENHKKYKCPHCEWIFVDNWSLKRHAKAHSNERPYKCPHCSKDYKDNSNLQKHIVAHHPSACMDNELIELRPYKCPHCAKYYKDNANRQTHIMVHHPSSPYNTFCMLSETSVSNGCTE